MSKLQHQELLVFADSYSPRLEYVIDTFCEQFGWIWTKNAEGVLNPTLSVSYTKEAPTGFSAVHIKPCGLLDEQDINLKRVPSWLEIEGVPSPLGEDLLASLFFLFTAYEEQLPGRKTDEYERVDESNLSIVKKGLAEIPLADRLMQLFAKRLFEAAGAKSSPNMIPIAGLSTLDIDSPTALAGKAAYRQGWVLAKAILKGDFTSVKGILSYFKSRVDPFDTRDYLKKIHAHHGLTPLYFMLLGYDTTLDPGWKANDVRYERLVYSYSEMGNIGIHPSYHTQDSQNLLIEEIERLRSVLSTEVTRSRQHFLRLKWPTTLQQLIDLNIKEDHSLAWAKTPGFRLGTARSIYWFDLSKNLKTNLLLVPPFVMDVTLRYRLQLSPKQAMEKISLISAECNKSNAGLRMIWHNSNLGPLHQWGRWRQVFEHALTLIGGDKH